MWKFKKLKKKTDCKLKPVMIYAKITELKDRYMIYNAVKNERKWEDKKMELDNEELEATRKLRKNRCEYCSESISNKKINDVDNHEGETAEIMFLGDVYLNVKLNGKDSDGYKTEDFFKINYCPMCGKKLN